MRNTILGRIQMYLLLWLTLFLILCVVSIIKNWDILMMVLNQTFMSFVSGAILIGIMIYAILVMIRGGFR